VTGELITDENLPRAEATTLCKAAWQAYQLECATYAAVISIDETDTISQMPATYGVPQDLNLVGPTAEGTLVAESWGAALEGGLEADLLEAGVFDANTFFWTGAAAGGGGSEANCSGWKSPENTAYGVVGLSGAVEPSEWLTAASSTCGEALPLLCACW
jgi:hypothetical protein